MEILGGMAKGVVLDAPAGLLVRPTAVRARRALFDSLGDLSGLTACDLFAGSGSLAFEALSRGAAEALLVEQSQASLAVIRSNWAKMSQRCPGAEISILEGAIPACFARLNSFRRPDLVFADPPYADSMNLLNAVLLDRSFTEWAADSKIIWEMPEKDAPDKPLPTEWKLLNIRKYGPVRFLFAART